MLEIAGGILIAAVALVVVLAMLRHIILALSASFCLAIAGVVWLLLARGIDDTGGVGDWPAAAILAIGFAIWWLSANPEVVSKWRSSSDEPKVD